MAQTYKVQAGSNLTRAAQAMGITLQQLLDANPQYKANPNMVQAGALLQYPVPVQQQTQQQQTQQQQTQQQQTQQQQTQQQQTQQQQTQQSVDITDPSWMLADKDFLNLSPDLQNYAKQYFTVLGTKDKASQQKLLTALTAAQPQADAYFGEIINIAKTNLASSIEGYKADFASQEKTLQESIARINEDLATKVGDYNTTTRTGTTGDISIDQQAELARQAATYQNNLDSLRENASGAGLTFSSKRAQAETQLATSNADVVESTKLNYMRQARDLDAAASRGNADALSKIADYKRSLGEQEMSALRGTEVVLGTSGLPALPGLEANATSVGGVTGSLYESRIKDIWARATALSDLNQLSNPSA